MMISLPSLKHLEMKQNKRHVLNRLEPKHKKYSFTAVYEKTYVTLQSMKHYPPTVPIISNSKR